MILVVFALFCTIFLLAMLILCLKDIILDDSEPDGKFVTIWSFLFSLIIFILLLFQLHVPKAIDVYRGKTTLEITYKDNIPIDSTVVWKDK